MLTAVIYSEKDAIRFLKDKPEVDRIFALTPDARAALFDINLPILNTIDHYSDYSHCRVLARVRRIERKIYLALDENDHLNEAVKETFRGIFHIIACVAVRLWYILRGTGPWLLPGTADWIYCDRLKKAHLLMLSYIISQDSLNNIKAEKLYFPRLVRFINYLISSFLRKETVLWITGREYGLKDLSKHALRIEPTTYVVRLAGFNRFNLLLSIFNLIKVCFGGKELVLAAVPEFSEEVVKQVEGLLELIDDEAIANATTAYRETLLNSAVFTDGLSTDLERIWQYTIPKALIAHQMRWLEGAALAETAKKYKTRSVLLSHGSHPIPADGVSEFEHRDNARGLLFSSLADETIVQSPHAERAAEKFCSGLHRRRFRPILWSYKKAPSIPANKDGIRRILHAGTYKLLGARPWIYETSDEFVKGLIALVRSAEKLENTQLIIRIRPAPECSLSSLKKLLPSAGNYIIKTTGNFIDDLLSSDLLVSFSSTTIEEALYVRRPVGLWGGTARYRHLPGTEKYPTKKRRSAVYCLTEKNLTSMLQAILDAHAGCLLSDEELAGYVWPKTVSGREEFLRSIICSK